MAPLSLPSGQQAVEAFLALEAQRPPCRARLLEDRRKKLRAGPAAFFRGAAGLFHQLLAQHPGARPLLRARPSAVLGDVHLENFGVLRLEGSAELLFAPNDFDEATSASAAVDTLRGAASAALSAAGLQLSLPAQARLAGLFLAGYGEGERPEAPALVQEHLRRAAQRERHRTYLERIELLQGRPRFKKGGPYFPLLSRERLQARDLFERWCASEPARSLGVTGKLEAAAFRKRGTGSLGVARYVFVTRTRGGDPVLLEAKQMRDSALALGGVPCKSARRETPAARVLTAARALLGGAPLGAAALEAEYGLPASFLLRVHTPSEDRINFEQDLPAKRVDAVKVLEELARFEGGVLAEAHQRSGAWDPGCADRVAQEVALDLASFLGRAWQAWLAAGAPMER